MGRLEKLRAFCVLTILGLPVSTMGAECIVSQDEFKGTQGVMVASEADYSATLVQTAIAYEENDEFVRYALVAYFALEDWKFLGDEAYDSDRTKLENIVTQRHAGSGRVVEMVQITVAKPYLQKHAESGIRIKIYGKRGSEEATFSPDLIREFLSCVESSGFE